MNSGRLRGLPTSFCNGVRFFEAAPLEPADNDMYLLVHGLGNSLDFWLAVAPSLSEARRTIATDIPGFGQSRAVSGEFTLTSTALALLRLCDSLSVENCVFIAHSMGAFVALQLIALEPTRFRRLILVDGTLGHAVMTIQSPNQILINPELACYVLAQFVGGVVPLNWQAAHLLTGSRLLRKATLWPYLARPGRADPGLLACALANNGGFGVVKALTAARHIDYLGLLRAINCPVDLVWGALDHLIKQADIDQAHLEMRVERTMRLDDCGHWPMIEQPASLIRFLASYA
jgi:pimeloyl-ACP methyl ester carboxylesterase